MIVYHDDSCPAAFHVECGGLWRHHLERLDRATMDAESMPGGCMCTLGAYTANDIDGRDISTVGPLPHPRATTAWVVSIVLLSCAGVGAGMAVGAHVLELLPNWIPLAVLGGGACWLLWRRRRDLEGDDR